jgi:hypothetical protein
MKNRRRIENCFLSPNPNPFISKVQTSFNADRAEIKLNSTTKMRICASMLPASQLSILLANKKVIVWT